MPQGSCNILQYPPRQAQMDRWSLYLLQETSVPIVCFPKMVLPDTDLRNISHSFVLIRKKTWLEPFTYSLKWGLWFHKTCCVCFWELTIEAYKTFFVCLLLFIYFILYANTFWTVLRNRKSAVTWVVNNNSWNSFSKLFPKGVCGCLHACPGILKASLLLILLGWQKSNLKMR